MQRKRFYLALMAAVLLGATPLLADDGFYVVGVGKRADGVGTKITSLPYTISSPGFYYLAQNLTYASATGSAITVSANDVTLDFMGFCLTGPGRLSNISSGITLSYGSNVEIRNGSLKGFGGQGIHVSSSPNCTGIRVIGIKVREIQNSGIELSGTGHLVMGCSVISVDGNGIFAGPNSMLKGNHVAQTGLTGIFGEVGSNIVGNVATSNGIIANAGSLVADNTVSGDSAHGITAAGNCTVTRNTASNNALAGIYGGNYCTITNNTTDGLENGSNCTLVNNTVTP